MSAFSKQLGDALLNHLLRNSALASPTTVYLALHVSGGASPAAPGDQAAAAFANEAAWTSYQRQAITFSAPTGTDDSEVTNDAAISFPEVDVGDGPVTVTGLSIWTAERGVDLGSSGLMLFQGAVDAAKELADTDAVLVPAGGVTVNLD